MLGLAGALAAGTGTYWDTRAQPCDMLGPTTQRLGHTGTHTLSAGTRWDPHPWPWDTLGHPGPPAPALGPAVLQHWDHQPSLAPPGAPKPPLQGAVPLSCAGRAVCSPPPPPLPPDKPGGRGRVSGAVWRISRLSVGAWDALATLRTNLSHPPRSPPGTGSHSCAALAAP